MRTEQKCENGEILQTEIKLPFHPRSRNHLILYVVSGSNPWAMAIRCNAQPRAVHETTKPRQSLLVPRARRSL